MAAFLPTPAGWPRILTGRAEALASDPTDLDVAVREGAFEGLRIAVRDLGPTGTIATVAASGLRGRGGAGFPTGEKWRACAAQPTDRRYVVANGYGADPAVSTDAALLAADPFAVIEGMVIAALAVGAVEAILAVRADDPALVARLEAAVGAAQEAGFAGPDVLGTGHDVELSVRTVQGAYMVGEETVLLKALEGRRGQPEQRPPWPAERGLFGRPTVVNNVQTLAAVPWIVRNGAPAFAGIGSKGSPGTVLVQLRGPEGAGVAEVPLGTPLRALAGLAGGTGSRSLKALLVGGPAGGLLPPDLLDTPYEFDALRSVGAHVGSGSIVIADDRACVVDLARVLTRYCAEQACGKTIPCRIGLQRMLEIGERMADGRPKPTDVALLGDLAHDIAASALCDHERLATLPLVSGMRYFRPELDEHLLHSSCPAGVCHPIAVAAGGSHQDSATHG
jgi:NADH:ubiquinone oxidoreductase subunit F (NADH-binding)